ncbi:MAG: hypothetical protein ACI8SE_001837 [Bacteroidia bacterium]|jgi:hypothetical protein
MAGIPEKNEAKAINLLFSWLQSDSTNVTIKSRAILVLFALTKKYPDLKNELRLSISDQLYKYTEDFAKRSRKILDELSA